MQPLWSSLPNKQCPRCYSTQLVHNQHHALCTSCKHHFMYEELNCVGSVVFRKKHQHHLCTGCGLVLFCISCLSTSLIVTDGYARCRRCGQQQTLTEVHNHHHQNQQYVRQFHKVMHTARVARHLSRNEEGQALLALLERISVEYWWPHPPNHQVEVVALGYRAYCRKYPFDRFSLEKRR